MARVDEQRLLAGFDDAVQVDALAEMEAVQCGRISAPSIKVVAVTWGYRTFKWRSLPWRSR